MEYGLRPLMNAPGLNLNGSARIGSIIIFNEVILEVKAGQWTCLLGPSGIGKTTILKLFAGLADEIDLTGNVSASDGDLQGRVTLMAQNDLLLPWLSVFDNVLLGARLRGEDLERERALEMLRKVDLVMKAEAKPRELSGGQRQRVALARTLMENRPIVLLDEPFSALDAMTRLKMQELTAELLTGKTVLLVTHDPGEAARLGHRILIMTKDGLYNFKSPSGRIPRSTDAAEVMNAQSKILSQLRSVPL